MENRTKSTDEPQVAKGNFTPERDKVPIGDPLSEPLLQTFSGIVYKDFLVEISRRRETRRYLEVGVNHGETFTSIHAEIAVGVDPDFKLIADPSANKRSTKLFRMSSDLFFEKESEDRFDLSFLDGMHLFEYLLRDFYNTEARSVANGLIVLHDCLPYHETIIGRTQGAGAWTGDVWKVVSILEKYRPDLKIVCVDCPPTGLVCVTNLDSNSTILKDNYLDLTSEFAAISNNRSSLLNFYQGRNILSSSSILAQNGQSLFFRT